MQNNEVFEYGYRNGRQLKHFLVDVTAAGYENLLRVLTVAFSANRGGTEEYTHHDGYATHMLLDGSRQLTFFFCYDNPRPPSALSSSAFDALFESITAFPQPIQAPQAAALTWEWLQRIQYPTDEHDGATYKGWRVFNEQFGIVGGHWDAFIAIRPMWMYVPK